VSENEEGFVCGNALLYPGVNESEREICMWGVLLNIRMRKIIVCILDLRRRERERVVSGNALLYLN